MVPIEDLKKIRFFRQLESGILEKLAPLCQVTIFSEKTILFKQGQKAEYFYALLKGKVLLEIELSQDISVSLDAAEAGEVFGWPALFEDGRYTSDAVCTEPCEVIQFPKERLLEQMQRDPELGFQIAKGAMALLKEKLEKRTEQFIKVLSMHPNLRELSP